MLESKFALRMVISQRDRLSQQLTLIRHTPRAPFHAKNLQDKTGVSIDTWRRRRKGGEEEKGEERGERIRHVLLQTTKYSLIADYRLQTEGTTV